MTATLKLWASHDLADVESFVNEAPLFQGLQADLRGGVFLNSVRQYARALQGKTYYRKARLCMSSGDFDQWEYLNSIEARASNPERPQTIFLSYYLTTLFRYGHYAEALKVAGQLIPIMEGIWCMRFYFSDLFYISLTYIAAVRLTPVRSDRDVLLRQVATNLEKIRTCAVVNNLNYEAWILLIEAEMADIADNQALAVRNYESALDHCELHGFILDAATIYELYGEALLRRDALRPARRLLMESMAAYRRVTCLGKADHVSTKHYAFLQNTCSLTTADAATQTVVLDAENSPYGLDENEERAESSAERTRAWLVPVESDSKQSGTQSDLQGGFSATGLDMIDLTSILESSQVLSSELQVDKLLAKMTEIIVESTGASLGAIVIAEEDVGYGSPIHVKELTGISLLECPCRICTSLLLV